MFGSLSGERLLSGGQSSSSPAGQAVASPGPGSQENSWIALLSRPAVFLQRYLSGRPRNPAVSDSGDPKTSFVDEEREFLRQLDDIDPVPHLAYLRCQHDAAAGPLQPGGGSASSWLSLDSLREIGIRSSEEMDLNLCQQTQIGYFSSARTFLSHVLLTSQEIKAPGGKGWVRTGESKSKTWWGSFWGGDESSPSGLRSDVSWAEEGAVTGRLCPQQLAAETKAPSAQTTDAFVQSGGGSEGWTLGENTGPADHKEEPANNGGLQTVQNTEGSTSDRRLGVSGHLSSPGAAAARSEVALLTPDQDNGYSSLEEEHFQMCHQYTAPSGEQQEAGSAETGAPVGTEMEEDTPEEGESASGKVDEGEETPEEEEDQEEGAQEGGSAEEAAVTSPQCQNKAIAFIMGCPCSDDDDSSQSEGESSDDEDDDGFDSEGSSDLTDSTDEDDDEASDSDSEPDSEADRLWTSLCQSADPYNPQNFTARLHTSSTPPRTIPASTPPSSAQSSPASSPDLTPLPLSSSSPPSGSDAWDDSTSASEVDEAESLRLWSSFSSSADPYSPFNFQAPLRTRVSGEAAPRTRTRAKKASSCSPHHNPASPPEYRKDGAEERLDSGFSEPSTSSSSTSSSSQSCSTTKKVRFCDQVEEFFASCGEEDEDRRGPWEELARDRCRFLRRCQDVELSIAYCLQPQHRNLVYHRLTVLYVQDT